MREKYEGQIITTYGKDVTGMTPEEVQAFGEALDDPHSPEFTEAFMEELRAAQAELLEGPFNKALDEVDERNVA